MFVEAVTVSVNYDDYLDLSLPYLKSQVDSVVVATSPQDRGTVLVCKKWGVRCVETDRIHRKVKIWDGTEAIPAMNKGGGLSEALALCQRSDWLLVVDADIVLPPDCRANFESMNPRKDFMYSAMRYTCKTLEEWKELENSKFTDNKLKIAPANNPIGYFQLFHSSQIATLPADQIYPDGIDARKVDILFRNRWPQSNWLAVKDLTVIHLGEGYVNWSGRVSERFQYVSFPTPTLL